MRIKVVTDIDGFKGLADEWGRLLATCEKKPLPLSHEWLFIWWQVFGGDRQLNIICVYAEEKLIAIAPFLIEQSHYRNIPVRIQKLMANGHSPFCDIIIDGTLTAEQKNDILEMISRCDNVDILSFNKIPEDSAIAIYIANKAERNEFCYGVKPSLITPVIRVAGEWEDFVRSKSRKFRKSLNNKLNRFDKAGDFTISCETIDSRHSPLLSEMVDISTQSWKRKIKNDLGTNTAAREFLLKIADVFGPKGQLRLWIAHKAEVPVAFEYHLQFDDVIYPIRADFAELYREFSPGSVLEYTALKSLFDGKIVNEYYSCADDYWYLNNWSKELKKHIHIELFSSTWKGRLLCELEYKLIPMLRLLRDRMPMFGKKK